MEESKILSSDSPFPKRQILDSSKLKEVADDNFKFDEHGRKFSKQVENTVGKGEIAPFPSVFKRLVLQTRKNQGLFGKELRVIAIKNSLLSLSRSRRGCTDL